MLQGRSFRKFRKLAKSSPHFTASCPIVVLCGWRDQLIDRNPDAKRDAHDLKTLRRFNSNAIQEDEPFSFHIGADVELALQGIQFQAIFFANSTDSCWALSSTVSTREFHTRPSSMYIISSGERSGKRGAMFLQL